MSSQVSQSVTITNRLGLHARPATMFAEAACRYAADVRVKRSDADECVDGKSIMQLLMLAATQGTTIEILAQGDGAEDVVRELITLVQADFNED